MAAPRRKPKPSPPGLTHLDPAGRPRTASTKARLLQLFQRNGCIRLPREERRLQLGRRYKKGWEVRLALKSQGELEKARELLTEAGLKAGKPYAKSRLYVQPIYGKVAVDFFTAGKAP